MISGVSVAKTCGNGTNCSTVCSEETNPNPCLTMITKDSVWNTTDVGGYCNDTEEGFCYKENFNPRPVTTHTTALVTTLNIHTLASTAITIEELENFFSRPVTTHTTALVTTLNIHTLASTAITIEKTSTKPNSAVIFDKFLKVCLSIFWTNLERFSRVCCHHPDLMKNVNDKIMLEMKCKCCMLGVSKHCPCNKTSAERKEVRANCRTCTLTIMDLSFCRPKVLTKHDLLAHPTCCFHPSVIALDSDGMNCRCCKLGSPAHCDGRNCCKPGVKCIDGIAQ